LTAATNEAYVVPSWRTYIRGMESVIHFILQEALGAKYNDLRGPLQEAYIAALISSAWPDGVLVRERQYRKGTNRVHGPDATFIRPGRNLIAIESKARKLRVDVKTTMREDLLDENLNDAFRALRLLRNKIDDLYAGLTEYRDVQIAIDRTERERALSVVIVGELPVFGRQITYDAKGPGSEITSGTHCLMTLDEFEMAVEISLRKGIELAVLLKEFWEDTLAADFASPSPELFRGRAEGIVSTFANELMGQVIEDEKRRKASRIESSPQNVRGINST